jgi:hypothetical protein
MKFLNASWRVNPGFRQTAGPGGPLFELNDGFSGHVEGLLLERGRSQSASVSCLATGLLAACVVFVCLPLAADAQTTNVIPPSYAYPLGSGDATKRGFVGKIHVARANESFNASIGRANAQLRDELIDNTLTPPAPYVNLVQTPSHAAPDNPNPVKADGTFVNTNVINYSISSTPPNDALDGGLFNSANGYTDARHPGLPGWTDDTYSFAENVNAFAWEEVAWVELPTGLITIGAHAQDAVQISIHRNDPRDLFRETPVWFDSNGGLQTRTGLLDVQMAGIYGFRIVHTVFGSPSSEIEFFTANPLDENDRTLVNDATVPTAAKAYQALTVPSRPYVDSVSPAIASSGIAVDAPIRVVLVNLGTTVPVLKVDASPVVFSTSTAGNQTTITYTKAGGWGSAKLVNVSVEYAGAVGSWTFQTKTGLKALVVGLSAGDTLIAQRLASKFGLDVDNLAEGTVSANSANNPDPEAGKSYLSKYKLIWNSEAVSSGGARPYINFLRDNALPIPAINVEQANVADWQLAGGGASPGGANVASVIITDPDSPFAAGLTGTVPLLKEGAPNGTWHTANSLPDYAFGSLGTALDEFTPAVFGVMEGADTGTYVHPARRVQMGIAGPGMVSNWSENAWAIFDATVRWVLNLPDEPTKFNAVVLNGKDVTISWTGKGTLQESSIVNGNWSNSVNQANPQTVPAVGTKFFRVKQ